MITWVVAGLGNPGKQYEQSRHNAGFLVAEAVARRLDASLWKMHKRFEALTAEAGEIIIMKPQGFMNTSGIWVASLTRYYKIPTSRLIVIHDDLDIPVGSVKAGMSKGPKIHNGVESVTRELGSADYWRVRIGIEERTGSDRATITPADYVLMSVKPEHVEAFTQSIEMGADRVIELLSWH